MGNEKQAGTKTAELDYSFIVLHNFLKAETTSPIFEGFNSEVQLYLHYQLEYAG